MTISLQTISSISSATGVTSWRGEGRRGGRWNSRGTRQRARVLGLGALMAPRPSGSRRASCRELSTSVRPESAPSPTTRAARACPSWRTTPHLSGACSTRTTGTRQPRSPTSRRTVLSRATRRSVLTYRCNEFCVHCYCPSDRILPELTLPQIDELLDELQGLGGFSLQLTGGEVFVRKDIRELLRSLRRRRLLLSITSNLTLLDDEGADLVSDLHPKSVGCSIYSARADLHDSITRHPGSFEKSLAGIRKLRDRGVPVAIKTPLMASTAPGWRDVVALATGLGCESQFDLNITARNDGDLGPVHHRVREEAVIADILRDAFPRVFFGDERPAAISGPSPDTLLCAAGATGLAVSPDGTIRPCIALTSGMGRWPVDSLTNVWRNSSFFSEWTAKKLRDIDRCASCASCEAGRFCIRCPGGWITESGDPLKPLDYSCHLSEIRSRVQI